MANKKNSTKKNSTEKKEVKNILEKDKKENEKVLEKNKKNNKKNIKDDSFDLETKRVIIVASVIIIIFCVFYLITCIVTGSNKKISDNDDTVVTSISYDNIILGRSFSMGDDEYLVLYYDKSDSDIASTYSSLASTYRNSDSALDLYVVNMGDAINKGNASEEANYEATNASELAINGPTVIKYSGGVIIDYVEGEEAITNYLS